MAYAAATGIVVTVVAAALSASVRPIGPWAILAVCGQGFLLVAVVRDAWPSLLGHLWGHPPGWPVNTRRVIHLWTDQPLPAALPLG